VRPLGALLGCRRGVTDATRDGRVTGSALGVIDEAQRTRWTPLVDRSGAPLHQEYNECFISA
jgi:hypothetical protein